MNRKATIAAGVAGAGAAGIATAMFRRHDDDAEDSFSQPALDATVAERSRELRRHLADLLGAQKHTLKVLRVQERDAGLIRFHDVSPLITAASQLLDSHVESTRDCLDDFGGAPGSFLRRMVTPLSGVVTGMFNRFRTEPVSRMLRDDVVALTLLAQGAGMLHATALAMGDFRVAAMAERQLRDLPLLVTRISDRIPGVVIEELEYDGMNIDTSAIPRAAATVKEAWTQQG